jgi:predicted CoA-binding protein
MQATPRLDGLTDAAIADILRTTTRIALVGASAKSDRPSNGVMRMLLSHGFAVTPVNPNLAGRVIHGQTGVASLAEAAPLDMVDVFRASDSVGPIIEEAARLGARTVWLQLGVINEQAAAAGRAAGLTVVMDRCPAIEVPRLRIERRTAAA